MVEYFSAWRLGWLQRWKENKVLRSSVFYKPPGNGFFSLLHLIRGNDVHLYFKQVIQLEWVTFTKIVLIPFPIATDKISKTSTGVQWDDIRKWEYDFLKIFLQAFQTCFFTSGLIKRLSLPIKCDSNCRSSQAELDFNQMLAILNRPVRS